MTTEDITDTPDGRKFTEAGFKHLPAGGGMYSWQKRQGEFVLQACDWETDGPFYLVGALHDDGSTLAYCEECGVDDALREFAVLQDLKPEHWSDFVSRNPAYVLT